MARLTFEDLQTRTKDTISLSSGSFASSTVANFIKDRLNDRYHDIMKMLPSWIVTDVPATASTVEDQQYYHYPPYIQAPILSATLLIGGVYYPLKIVHSQDQWDRINEIDFSGTTIPQYIFPRRDDFGIYPTPAEDDDTITLNGRLLDKDMSADDYTTGTVTVAANSATVTGSGTTFTTAMEGRWYKTDDDGFWYRVSSVAGATSLTLESVFEGTSSSGESYTIGETPELPTELHRFLPFGAAADFYAGPKKDLQSAQIMENYYFTGDYSNPSRDLEDIRSGVLGAIARYSSRGGGRLVRSSRRSVARFDERFSSTLS